MFLVTEEKLLNQQTEKFALFHLHKKNSGSSCYVEDINIKDNLDDNAKYFHFFILKTNSLEVHHTI